jgi:dolichyl-phosphate beta-glucosyltransferase
VTARPAEVGGNAGHAAGPMIQVVVPAYNEAQRLPRTLVLLGSWLGEAHPEWAGRLEVLVVDNASTDGTADVARMLSTPQVPVSVLHCPEPGKGAAVRAGILATTAELVAFVDADGATSFDAFTQAVEHIRRGADVAIGSRAVSGSVTMARHSGLRERGAAAYRWCTARLVDDVRDTQCGFKVFRGALARAVADDLVATGFSFDVELLVRLRSLGAGIDEIPVTWTDVPGSTFVPVRHGAGAFAELAAIAWRTRQLVTPVAGRAAVGARPQSPMPLPAPVALPVALAVPASASLLGEA